MTLTRENPFIGTRQDFCLALKTARERKGITLDEIAKTTKIPARLFAAFEQNDMRGWPKGIFRRSFFRAYIRTIGLPVAGTCADFVRLFPDDYAAEPGTGAETSNACNQGQDIRLMLDAAWHGPRRSIVSRLLAVLMDVAVVIMLAAAAARISGVGRLETTAIVALVYFSLAAVLFDRSLAQSVISRRRSIRDAVTHAPAVIAHSWSRGTEAIAHWFSSAGGNRPKPVEEPEEGFTRLTL